MYRRIAKTTLKTLGLKKVTRKALARLELHHLPRQAWQRRQRYHEPTDPEVINTATTVSFPQADHYYEPPLFYPTGLYAENPRMKLAFLTLHETLGELGCLVNRCSPEQANFTVDWSGRDVDYKTQAPSLIMEHGWLPRSSYQLSDQGANARSHVAKSYRFRQLNAHQEQLVLNHMDRMRRLFASRLDEATVDRVGKQFNEPFIMFPLQLAHDFNLRYSNSPFSDFYSRKPTGSIDFAQACIDHLESAQLPLPIVFKQHPCDESDIHQALKLRDRRNRLVTNAQKVNSLALFASGNCKLVVSVNSNTLHEGLVWNIPVISLGTLLWDESREDRPLDKDLAAAERLLGSEKVLDDTRLSYLYHVITNQWHLSDFQNPLIVQELLRTRAHCVPFELRCRWGLDLATDNQQQE